MTADAVGGVWTYAVELARALKARGIDVVLATMGPMPSGLQCREVPAGVRIEMERFALEWMDDPFPDVDRAGAWLLELERHYAPDVMHVNGYAHGALPTRAPRVLVAHSCVGSWFRAVKGESLPQRYGVYRERLLAGIAKADAVVAPTKAMQDALLEVYGLTIDDRFCVIYNGIGGETPNGGQKTRSVIAVGRVWDEAKNVAAVCSIASELPWPVTIVGPVHREDADLECSSAGPVRFIGRLSNREVRRLLGRSPIFVHPARYEPFGLGPLEAATAGCALVLGDIPSLREVWGDAALFVDPEDHRALRDTLRRVIGDDALRADLANKAGARAGRYSLNSMADAYVALYTRVLAGKNTEHSCGSSSSRTLSSLIGTTAMHTSSAAW